MRASQNHALLAQYSGALIPELEAETGQSTGFRKVGSLSVAHTEARFEELKRVASMNNAFGVTQVDIISPAEAQQLAPILKTNDLLGASWVEADGHASPVDVTTAFIKGARGRGVNCLEGVSVIDIKINAGRVSAVVTTEGEIRCDFVVIAAGLWSRHIGRLCGVNIALHACEHYYAHTEKRPEFTTDLPVIRDHDICAYIREDAGSLLVGAFEPNAVPVRLSDIPADFAFDELPGHAEEQLMPILESTMQRIPILQEVGWRSLFCGPESFTPDDQFHLGEAPEVDNVFMACGLNSIGIQSSGGVGKALAEWMDSGRPPMDIWTNDPRRMFPFHSTDGFLRQRVSETLGLLYARHYPFRQYETARDIRHSPLHERLKEKRACFGEAAGWERPNWFADDGMAPVYEYSFGKQNWFHCSAREHQAARESLALFDQTSFAKYIVKGADAYRVLQYICSADVDVEPGRIVYTHWLNDHGGIEADLTVTRLGENEFFIVSGAGVAIRDMHWLSRHIPIDANCVCVDVTSGWSVLGLMGPNSRALMSALCPSEDLGGDHFRFGDWRALEIGCAPVRAVRVSYVGELGWELYVTSDQARHVFDTIVAAGQDHGLTMAGMHALDSCRIEKAFRHFGHDISDEDTPVEAGMSFVCNMKKPIRFKGYDAIAKQRESTPLPKRMVQFLLQDPDAMLYHHEPIWHDGQLIGHLTSGNYGHTLGGSVGLGYIHHDPGVDKAFVNAGQFEIEVAGERIPAKASLSALYDPKGERMRS
jgi:4-methylaminobutanoate oxidase (formaldehyde-forming)